MKKTLFFLIVFITTAPQALAKDRFFDSSGNSLEKYTHLWNELYNFYGRYLPDTITVNYGCQGGSSTFDAENNALTVDVSRRDNVNYIIAHETSHIALHHMTAGVSGTEHMRFIDEGWASLLAERVSGSPEKYLKKAFYESCLERKARRATLGNLQNWSSYFGNWSGASTNRSQTKNFVAYSVGSTVAEYIITTYGEDSFKKLLVDLGKTKDLSKSLKNILQLDAKEFETGWLDYLDKNCREIEMDPNAYVQPSVVELYPKNNSRSVQPTINALIVKFNVPMGQNFCVVTPSCDDICYKNAHWNDAQTLIIDLPKQLKKNSEYQLSLGSKDSNCRFKSLSGWSLPVIEWGFRTR